MTHRFEVRIYWEDTDAGGVVYYSNYFKFTERARTEALREAGFDQSQLLAEHGIALVVKSCRAEFLTPAHLDDLLTIETRLHDIGAASLTLSQTILRNGERVAEMDVRLASINLHFRPARIPEPVRKVLGRAFEEPLKKRQKKG